MGIGFNVFIDAQHMGVDITQTLGALSTAEGVRRPCFGCLSCPCWNMALGCHDPPTFVPMGSVKGKGPGWMHEETQHPGAGGDLEVIQAPHLPMSQERRHATFSPSSGGLQPQG